MPVAPELRDLRPATIRGLYGYDIEEACCEQTHVVLYRGRRKIDGLKVLVKLLRNSATAEWGSDWFQRDHQISHGLEGSYQRQRGWRPYPIAD